VGSSLARVAQSPMAPTHRRRRRTRSDDRAREYHPGGQRRAKSLSVDPRTSLLDLLREQLQLTGTKEGCDQGACGTCTVLVGGRRINTCLTLAVMHHGRSVRILGRPEAGTRGPYEAG
jgi:hypothetical protein